MLSLLYTAFANHYHGHAKSRPLSSSSSSGRFRAASHDRAHWSEARREQRSARGSADPGGVPRRNYSDVHLVVPRHSESLEWLYNGWGAEYTHTVYDKSRGEADFSAGFVQMAEPGDGSVYHMTNFGDEAAAYLRFIIDHYDDLPKITVFVHGKPLQHNPRLATWIGCLKPQTWFTYLTQNFIDDRCIVDKGNASLVPKFDSGAFADFWVSFPWAELGWAELPRCLSFYCCAEFALSRAAIRSKPLSFYKRIWSHTINFITDENLSRKYKGWGLKQIGGVFEHIWHVMFGEVMMMHPYHYCDYFQPMCGPCKSQYHLPSAQLPPNHPKSKTTVRGVRILSAFYASNCHLDEPLTAKETSDILGNVKRLCDGRSQCTLHFNATDSIARRYSKAKPCPKSLAIEWMCPGDTPASPSRKLTVEGEAHGKHVEGVRCAEGVVSAVSELPAHTVCSSALFAAEEGDVKNLALCRETDSSCQLSGPVGAEYSCAMVCKALSMDCTDTKLSSDPSSHPHCKWTNQGKPSCDAKTNTCVCRKGGGGGGG